MDAAVTFARPRIKADTRADRSLLIRSVAPLGDHADHLGQEPRWADATPDAVMATEPGAGGRLALGYAEARRAADAIGQGLLDRGATPERPVLLLSGNSLAHLLLTLACSRWPATRWACPRCRPAWPTR